MIASTRKSGRNRRIYKRMKHHSAQNLAKIWSRWGRDTVVIITQMYTAERLIHGGVDLTSKSGPYVVGMYHGSYEEAARNNDVKRLKNCFKNVDKFVVLTSKDSAIFRNNKFSNVSFIHNPVRFKQSKKMSKKEKVVVSLGRYHSEKSLDYLIEVWSELAGEYPDWRLEMYGSGNKEAKLQKLISELGIERSAFLKGKTNNVPSVLGRASVHALSSQHEGLPLAIVEAARFEVPTVSFNCAPGISELIDDGVTGIITPPNNSHLLAEGLRTYLQDRSVRLSAGRKARIKSKAYETHE